MPLLGAMCHVGITVSDLNGAMEFFKPFLEFLGYEIWDEIGNPNGQRNRVAVNHGNGAVLTLWEAKPEFAGHPFQVYEVGLHHIAATRARQMIPKILAAPCDEVTGLMREIVSSLYAFMLQIDQRIRAFDRKIDAIFKASDVCQRIAKIRGIGPKTATAMIAAIGDGSDFKNGRHLAAWLGLVPRQHSSGDRRVMMGISKRGSQHLRTLLVHGARAVVRTAVRRTDPKSIWVNELRQRRGYNRATVAAANKNARVIWAVLASGEPYRSAA